MFALLFFIADVTLSGTDSKFLPIYIKKAKHLYKLYTVVDLKPLPIKGTQAVGIEFFVYIKSCQYSMFYTNKMF